MFAFLWAACTHLLVCVNTWTNFWTNVIAFELYFCCDQWSWFVNQTILCGTIHTIQLKQIAKMRRIVAWYNPQKKRYLGIRMKNNCQAASKKRPKNTFFRQFSCVCVWAISKWTIHLWFKAPFCSVGTSDDQLNRCKIYVCKPHVCVRSVCWTKMAIWAMICTPLDPKYTNRYRWFKWNSVLFFLQVKIDYIPHIL